MYELIFVFYYGINTNGISNINFIIITQLIANYNCVIFG